MKILIFGGNGFVGKYLYEELISNMHEVISVDLLSNDINSIVDITNVYEVEKVICTYKPDCVVNLAGISSVATSRSIPQDTIRINTIGSLNILESIKKNNLKSKVLLIGSSEEYSTKKRKINENDELNYSSPYCISKIIQEKFADIYRDKYALKIVETRTFNHTGPKQKDLFVIPNFINQVKQAKNGDTIHVGNINIYRDIGDVRDMVKAYRCLIENDCKENIYNVGSGKTYMLLDFLNYIIKISKKQLKIEIDKTRIRPIDNEYVCCDNSRLFKEFNISYEHDIFETIAEMYFEADKM